MGYRAAKATKKQRLPPSKLSLLLGMLGGPTLPQGDEGCTVQAEGSRAMRHGLGTHGEMRAQEDWVGVPMGLLRPAQSKDKACPTGSSLGVRTWRQGSISRGATFPATPVQAWPWDHSAAQSAL